ncbi:MAG: orotidine-5'-phosphate decarboxylase [Candidatus Melainabacteria bacterium]
MTVSPDIARRLIVALDLPDAETALALARQIAPLGVTFKVGMQLFYETGPDLVRQLQAESGRVFVDLKLHDIPTTVAKATRSLMSHGVSFLNVHATGGQAMMSAAAEAAQAAAAEFSLPDPILLGVTVLTSMDQAQLNDWLRVPGKLSEQVVHLAKLSQQSGLQGVVCSAQEAPLIREACGPDFLLVTPGIRPAGSAADDQSRMLTPAQALQQGSDYLVVGRPITADGDPVAATSAILADMAGVLPSGAR